MAQFREDSGNPDPEPLGWALAGKSSKGVEGYGVGGQASGAVGFQEPLWFR